MVWRELPLCTDGVRHDALFPFPFSSFEADIQGVPTSQEEGRTVVPTTAMAWLERARVPAACGRRQRQTRAMMVLARLVLDTFAVSSSQQMTMRWDDWAL